MDSVKAPSKKISQAIVTIFGLSEITALFVASLNTQHFAFYITDILLISPLVMGTVLMVTRTFDIATILISSVVEERMNLKWGKYRSWLLIMIPLAFVAGIVQYSGLGATANAKLLVSAVGYVLFFGFFNFGRTAQMALLNTIGTTPEERATLSARKAQFASMAGIILNATFIPLALYFSGGETKTDITGTAFFMTVIIFQVIYLAAQMGLFKGSKEYDLPVDEKSADAVAIKKNKLSGAEMVQQIVKNPPLMFMLISETCKTVASTLVLSMVIYYFRVVAGDLTLQPIFATSISVAGFIGTLFAGQFLVKKLGKKTTYTLGFGASALAVLMARLFAGNNTFIFIAIMCVGWFFYTSIATSGPAMFGDCVEYGKYKIGKEGRAFIMGLYTLPIKVGVLLAGGLSGFLLAAINYSAESTLTPELKAGLFNIITLAPAIVLGIGFVCALLYPLTEKRVKEIMASNRSK